MTNDETEPATTPLTAKGLALPLTIAAVVASLLIWGLIYLGIAAYHGWHNIQELDHKLTELYNNSEPLDPACFRYSDGLFGGKTYICDAPH